MKTLSVPALVFLGLISYSGAETQAQASSGWQRSESTYEVPVPAGLADFAIFELEDVRSRTRNGVTEIKYNLPMELTGVPNRIRLKSIGNGKFTGPHAEGVCADDVCNLKYKDLKFDESAVRDLLRNRGVEGLEFEKRMQVFSSFSIDPGGIIRRKPIKRY